MLINNNPICAYKNIEYASYYGCKMLFDRFGISECQSKENPELIKYSHKLELEKRKKLEKTTWSERKHNI